MDRWWNVGMVADLCRKLDGIKEANGDLTGAPPTRIAELLKG
jgi:hypothetical protein